MHSLLRPQLRTGSLVWRVSHHHLLSCYQSSSSRTRSPRPIYMRYICIYHCSCRRAKRLPVFVHFVRRARVSRYAGLQGTDSDHRVVRSIIPSAVQSIPLPSTNAHVCMTLMSSQVCCGCVWYWHVPRCHVCVLAATSSYSVRKRPAAMHARMCNIMDV